MNSISLLQFLELPTLLMFSQPSFFFIPCGCIQMRKQPKRSRTAVVRFSKLYWSWNKCLLSNPFTQVKWWAANNGTQRAVSGDSTLFKGISVVPLVVLWFEPLLINSLTTMRPAAPRHRVHLRYQYKTTWLHHISTCITVCGRCNLNGVFEEKCCIIHVAWYFMLFSSLWVTWGYERTFYTNEPSPTVFVSHSVEQSRTESKSNRKMLTAALKQSTKFINLLQFKI